MLSISKYCIELFTASVNLDILYSPIRVLLCTSSCFHITIKQYHCMYFIGYFRHDDFLNGRLSAFNCFFNYYSVFNEVIFIFFFDTKYVIRLWIASWGPIKSHFDIVFRENERVQRIAEYFQHVSDSNRLSFHVPCPSHL